METHILFFILAGLLIAILVGASIWSSRREKSRIFSNTFSTRPPASPINHSLNNEIPSSLSSSGFNDHTVADNTQYINDNFAQTQQHEIEQSINNIKISLPNNEGQAVSFEAQSANMAQPEPIIEPAFTVNEPPIQVQLEQPHSQPEMTQAQVIENLPPQIVTLYVVAAEGQQFYGENIVQNLENLGFQYGEYQIFHRHLDNPTSPILFSVANMMQPGIFDLNTLDRFTTVGLTFFMQLPSVGNDLANLRLMIRTVESFAQAIGGFVLNEQHQLFDDHSRQEYLLRLSQQG